MKYDEFQTYLKRTYTVADECRKQWRSEGKVPDSKSIKLTFGDNFPNVTGDKVKTLDQVAWDKFLESVKSYKVIFSNAKNTPEEQKSLLESLKRVKEDKKKKRT